VLAREKLKALDCADVCAMYPHEYGRLLNVQEAREVQLFSCDLLYLMHSSVSSILRGNVVTGHLLHRWTVSSNSRKRHFQATREGTKFILNTATSDAELCGVGKCILCSKCQPHCAPAKQCQCYSHHPVLPFRETRLWYSEASSSEACSSMIVVCFACCARQCRVG
jgi:hypothetical protein